MPRKATTGRLCAAYFSSFLRTFFAHVEFVSSERRHKSRDWKILFFNLCPLCSV